MLCAECFDEAHLKRETFINVGVQVAFELAQYANAFGDVSRLPFGGEGGGGFLKLGQVEMLGSGLLAGDIAAKRKALADFVGQLTVE